MKTAPQTKLAAGQAWGGKILLAGEYAVTHRPYALALALNQWAGHWEKITTSPDPAWLKFGAWLANHDWPWLQLALWKQEYPQYHFVSPLPQGRGLGSSGALCAAIYDRYKVPEGFSADEAALREQLAALENYFHGVSSGFDPLVSLRRRTCVMMNGHLALLPENATLVLQEQRPSAGQDSYFLFLWDSQIPRTTLGLMDFYQKAYQGQEAWIQELALAQEYLVIALKDFLCQETLAARPDLTSSWGQVSRLQARQMAPMILPAVQPLWQGEGYQLKLCGKGGGGFYLGLAKRDADLRVLQQQGKLWYLVRP